MADLYDPLADTAVLLGFSLPHPVLEMVHECAQGLPITAGHYVQTGTRTYRVYWVSGSSLVTFECGETDQTNFGLLTPAEVSIRSLAAAHIEVDVFALTPIGMDDRSVTLKVRAYFDGDHDDPVNLPDTAFAMDDQSNRDQASKFVTAVLRAATQPLA